MKKMEVFKGLVSMIGSIGIGAIVGNLVDATTPRKVKGIGKIIIAFGSLAITGIASKEANKYIEASIDEVVDSVQKLGNEPVEELKVL